MQCYAKGARNERELIRWFAAHGYEVIRAAGSGVNTLSPDLLVFRRGDQYAFECKAWNRDRLHIENARIDALKQWEENAGITTMIAWKIPRNGWYFLYLEELERQEKYTTISREKVLAIGRTQEMFV